MRESIRMLFDPRVAPPFGRPAATIVFWLSLAGAFSGDILCVLAANGKLPVFPAVAGATLLFGIGGLEGYLIYRGMDLLTVAWLWPAMMQVAHTFAAIVVFHKPVHGQELAGSAVVLVGVVIAGWPR